MQADRLEGKAEVALLESELAIEQHLRDFPDADQDRCTISRRLLQEEEGWIIPKYTDNTRAPSIRCILVHEEEEAPK